MCWVQVILSESLEIFVITFPQNSWPDFSITVYWIPSHNFC